ncbi:MAG: NUDIX domain-containing protein [Defluviitaleaceae bacterium]|nr:NUDIX domain-containing protein [Defluviitaleaceae bacterium]
MIFYNARAIITKVEGDGEIVLVQRCNRTGVPGRYKFPGGCSEWGESIMDTLKREVMEEVGLTVTKIHGIETYRNNGDYESFTPFAVYFGKEGWVFKDGEFAGQRAKSVGVHFICEAVGTPLESGDKSTEIGWVTPERLRAILNENGSFGDGDRGAAELYCVKNGV